jgi:hypothetical protein
MFTQSTGLKKIGATGCILAALFYGAAVRAEGTATTQNAPLGTGAEASHPAPLDTGALKTQAAGKILVVLIYDKHCKVWCENVRPIMKQLASEYGEKIFVTEVDNSPDSAERAIEQVKALDILRYYKDVESVPVVMVFDARRKSFHEVNGPKNKDTYREAIEKILSKNR